MYSSEVGKKQGDQIGLIWAYRASVYFGHLKTITVVCTPNFWVTFSHFFA
jgi:hypothetical protein